MSSVETYHSEYEPSISLTGDPTRSLQPVERLAAGVAGLGILFLLVALFTGGSDPILFLSLSLGLTVTGSLLFFWHYWLRQSPGVRQEGTMFSRAKTRSLFGWVLAVVLTGFYVLLYWFPETLDGLIRITDPLSYTLRGSEANQWFLYGTLYTTAVLVMGVRAILKYRHSRYHLWKSVSVMFFQLILGYLIPAALILINQPEFYFHYFWPLKYDYLFPGTVGYMESTGGFGALAIRWAMLMTFVGTPVLTWFYGKRWYCSFVCGCGGLAETAGDPYRHLSDKSLSAWKIERWMIHTVLLLITVITVLLWINSWNQGATLGSIGPILEQWYWFVIGATFAGVIGVGFYPLMGARVWCRFGCPMAAVLGIGQKFFSRFRITTNSAQCISCGNCSTYCEMGIDVRWYAQRGQNIIRASCVGCGICSTVCPRGVLKLENGPRKGRYSEPVLVPEGDVILPRKDPELLRKWQERAFGQSKEEGASGELS